MISQRQKTTLLYLITATLISWVCIYFVDQLQPTGLLLFIAPPLLLGTALILSNYEYLKNRYSYFLPVIFLIIYAYGTLPFLTLGEQIFHNAFGSKLLGCASAFILVTITIKLTIEI